MKVSNNNLCQFKDIEPGDVFLYDSKAYMKLSDKFKDAVNLYDGTLIDMYQDEKIVFCPDADLHICCELSF